MKTRQKCISEPLLEEQITDECLEQISGGINPQPEPPGSYFKTTIKHPISLPHDVKNVKDIMALPV